VVILPSLHRDIASVVDNTLSSIQDRDITLPPASPETFFNTTEVREFVDAENAQPMINERSVANFYLLTTARYCSGVASTLAIHPRAPNWTGILKYDQVPSRSQYAIADGVLRIRPTIRDVLCGKRPPTKEEATKLNAIDESTREGLIALGSKFSDFMTSEIKSLSVAPEEVMAQIGDLANGSKFPWTECHDVDFGRHQTTFGLYGSDGKSVDATVTPWTIPSGISSSDQTSSDPVPSSSVSALTSSDPTSNDPMYTKPRQSLRLKAKAKAFVKTLFKLRSGEHEEVPSDGESERGQSKGKQKRKRDDDDDEENQNRRTPTAKSFLQQVLISRRFMPRPLDFDFDLSYRRGRKQ